MDVTGELIFRIDSSGSLRTNCDTITDGVSVEQDSELQNKKSGQLTHNLMLSGQVETPGQMSNHMVKDLSRLWEYYFKLSSFSTSTSKIGKDF